MPNRIPSELTADKLLPRIQAALKAWYSLEDDPDSRLDSFLLARGKMPESPAARSPATLRRATNEVLIAALERLGTSDPRSSLLLRARFLDLHMGREVASQLNLSLDQVNRLQAIALRRLTEIIVESETELWAARADALEDTLPPAQYHRLFGVDTLLRQLVAALQNPELSPIVVLTGVGGIGKTALADAAARLLVPDPAFSGILWITLAGEPTPTPREEVSFQQWVDPLWSRLFPQDLPPSSGHERLARIRATLKSRPHLIVIDNLESAQDLAALLENLPGLATPSRFLLTSRIRPPTHAGTLVFALNELDPTAAEQLVLDHATQIGLKDAESLSSTEASTLVQTLGGNPLALRLAIGLAALQPFDRVLTEFVQCHAQSVEQLYRLIYWRHWRSLTTSARAILSATPLIAENGTTPEHLVAVSGIAEGQFWPAVQELISRSLLEVRGTLRDRRYGVHRLTELFVHSALAAQDPDQSSTA